MELHITDPRKRLEIVRAYESERRDATDHVASRLEKIEYFVDRVDRLAPTGRRLVDLVRTRWIGPLLQEFRSPDIAAEYARALANAADPDYLNLDECIAVAESEIRLLLVEFGTSEIAFQLARVYSNATLALASPEECWSIGDQRIRPILEKHRTTQIASLLAGAFVNASTIAPSFSECMRIADSNVRPLLEEFPSAELAGRLAMVLTNAANQLECSLDQCKTICEAQIRQLYCLYETEEIAEALALALASLGRKSSSWSDKLAIGDCKIRPLLDKFGSPKIAKALSNAWSYSVANCSDVDVVRSTVGKLGDLLGRFPMRDVGFAVVVANAHYMEIERDSLRRKQALSLSTVIARRWPSEGVLQNIVATYIRLDWKENPVELIGSLAQREYALPFVWQAYVDSLHRTEKEKEVDFAICSPLWRRSKLVKAPRDRLLKPPSGKTLLHWYSLDQFGLLYAALEDFPPGGRYDAIVKEIGQLGFDVEGMVAVSLYMLTAVRLTLE